MLSVVGLKSLLAEHGLAPNKRLGQNFLINESALEDLVAAADISSSDTVVEVGGGVGTITEEVAKRAGKVIVVEKDKALAPILRERTKDFRNVQVVEGDVLAFDTKYQIQNTKYKLVGAPPYYLTARLFRKFLEEEKIKSDNAASLASEADEDTRGISDGLHAAERQASLKFPREAKQFASRPSRIALIIQKEVAQKICAQPPDMSLLALSVQIYGSPKIIREISRGCFWPQPSVDSALLIVDIFPSPQIEEPLLPQFFKIVKAAFGNPRKQLQNTLQKILGENAREALQGATIDPARRPETLRVEEWRRLAEISLRS